MIGVEASRTDDRVAAQGIDWGRVPERFLALVSVLMAEIAEGSQALAGIPWSSNVGDADPQILGALSASKKVNVASKDLRSAITAYAHKIHQPRPRVSAIADAQRTPTQGLTRRYTDAVEDAVRSLIDGESTPEQLASVFRSLAPEAAKRIIDMPSTHTSIEVGPLVFLGVPETALHRSGDQL